MRRRLTLGLATLLTCIALGGAAQAQLPIRIVDPNTGATIQTTPWGTPYYYNYSTPSSSYYYYDTTPSSNYYYNTYPSSSYYYNYEVNPRTARNRYYRNSRGFPAAHERQNYYYDNRYYYRYR